MTRAIVLFLVAVLLLGLAGCSGRSQRLYRRAETFLAQGKYEQAAADYSALLRQSPRDELADSALYKLAYLYREEFGEPQTAVSLYQRLVDYYPRSAFLGDALMWMVYLQGRQLGDPAAVARTCARIDELLPEEGRMRAQAYLELGRAYLQAGEADKARAALEKVRSEFAGESEARAEAQFRLALLVRDQDQQPEQAVKLLEAVVEEHPETRAAARARQALGWGYYEAQKGREEERRAELRRQARVLGGVGPLAAEEHPSLQLLAGLRVLLEQAGQRVSLEELMCETGIAFQMMADWANPARVLYFTRNPLTTTAEAWGFGYNAWSFRSAEQALPSLAGSLGNGRPVLLLHGGNQPQWCLFTGYRPEEGQVQVLRPGRRQAEALSEAAFGQGWPRTVGARVFPLLPAEGYQFALAQRMATPQGSEVLRGAILRAAVGLEQREMMGAPAGRAGYRALVEAFSMGSEAEEKLQQVRKWAQRAAPLLARARQAAGSALAANAGGFGEGQRRAVQEAAERYAGLAEGWRSLNAALQAVEEPPPPGWSPIPLRLEAEALAAEEQRALESLAAALGG